MRHYSRTELERVYDSILGERMPGAQAQGIHQLSTAKRYKIGARMKLGNAVYHYGRAGGAVHPNWGAKVKNEQDISREIIGAVAVAGATSIVLTLDNTDGPTYNGLLPANYLEGGTVMISAALGQCRRGILSNTAVTVNAATATFTVVLDAPMPFALAITDVAEAIASPYACVVHFDDVHSDLETWQPVAGVPTLVAALNDYLWLLTWGPIFVNPAGEVGDVADDISVYFGGNGALRDFTGGTGSQQRAGHILATNKGSGQGQPFFMLMIDP